LSLCAIPAVLQAGAPADVMCRQFYIIITNGALIPITAVASALSYGAVSYGKWTVGLEWKGFALGGAFTAALIPFTIALILPTNKELSAAAKSQAKTVTDRRARGLITKWARLNTARIFLPLAGAVVGLWSLRA
jgi:hypothetical protein